MKMDMSVEKDMVTPDLTARIKAAKNRRAVLRAMGMAVVNLTKQAFHDPSVRPAPWPDRKSDTGKKLLVKSSLLLRSIRVVESTNDAVTVGSDRPYAAIHQLGGLKKPIPPRPFFPILGTPSSPELTERAREAVERAATRKLDGKKS